MPTPEKKNFPVTYTVILAYSQYLFFLLSLEVVDRKYGNENSWGLVFLQRKGVGVGKLSLILNFFILFFLFFSFNF